MATSNAGIIGGALAAAAALVALVWAGSKSSANAQPQPSPPPPPKPQPTTTWARATTINPNDHVRISLNASDVALLAAAQGFPVSLAGFQQLLNSPIATNFFQFTGGLFVAYGPSDTLPSDWPSDDPSPSSEYHAQFVYGGTAPVSTTASPLPLIAWTSRTNVGVVNQGGWGAGQGSGGGGGGVQGGGGHIPVGFTWIKATTGNVSPGDKVSVSIPPGGVQAMTYPASLAPTVAGVTSAIQNFGGLGVQVAPAQGTQLPTLNVWAPGDPSLPADWPQNDPNLATDWHVRFVVGGSQPVAVSAIQHVDAVWIARFIFRPIVSGTTGDLPGSFWDNYFPGASRTIAGLVFLYGWDNQNNAWEELGPAWPSAQATTSGVSTFGTGVCDVLGILSGGPAGSAAATYVLAFWLAPNASNWAWVMFAPFSAQQIAAIQFDSSGCPANVPAPTVYAAGYVPV